MVELGKKATRGWLRLRRVHDRLTAAVEDALKGANLPPLVWHETLAELERGPPEGLRPFEIERALGAAQSNVSRLLDRMAKAGVIERAACEADRRGWRVRQTEAGRQLRARMWERCSGVIADKFAGRLSDKQIRQLDDILGDLIDKRG